VTGRFPRSQLHQPNSHENRDRAVSSRNELEAIILTGSVSWWKKPAREKIHPCAGQPAHSAVLEGRQARAAVQDGQRLPLRPRTKACSGGPEISSIVDQVALTRHAKPVEFEGDLA
jgi:hypothetical protein